MRITDEEEIVISLSLKSNKKEINNTFSLANLSPLIPQICDY